MNKTTIYGHDVEWRCVKAANISSLTEDYTAKILEELMNGTKTGVIFNLKPEGCVVEWSIKDWRSIAMDLYNSIRKSAIIQDGYLIEQLKAFEGKAQICNFNNLELPTAITTIDEAKGLLNALHTKKLLFHPESSALDIVGNPFSITVAIQLDKLMDDIHGLKLFDASQYYLDLISIENSRVFQDFVKSQNRDDSFSFKVTDCITIEEEKHIGFIDGMIIGSDDDDYFIKWSDMNQPVHHPKSDMHQSAILTTIFEQQIKPKLVPCYSHN